MTFKAAILTVFKVWYSNFVSAYLFLCCIVNTLITMAKQNAIFYYRLLLSIFVTHSCSSLPLLSLSAAQVAERINCSSFSFNSWPYVSRDRQKPESGTILLPRNEPLNPLIIQPELSTSTETPHSTTLPARPKGTGHLLLV